VLAAAAGDRVRRLTAVAVAVLSFVVLSSSLNLAIVTRWPGVVVEVIGLVALAVWTIRRRRELAGDATQPVSALRNADTD
jgi:hypothetical protein